MGVFKAGDKVRLGLEAAHELGPVRQLGTYLFDRHLAPDRGLGRLPHKGERPFPELGAHHVGPQPPLPRLHHQQGRVARQDPVLQCAQRCSRFEPGLGRELGAVALECPQRLGLSPAPEQRHHELTLAALPERLSGHRQLRLGDRVRRPTGRQQGIEPVLFHAATELLETPGLGGCPRQLGDVLEGAPGATGSTPGRQRYLGGRGRRRLPSKFGDQRIEAIGVDIVPVQLQCVPAPAGDDQAVTLR